MIDTPEDTPPLTEPPLEDLQDARRREPLPSSPTLDRAPPHSVEAEQGVLGCILLDPGPGLARCLEKIRVPVVLDAPPRPRARPGEAPPLEEPSAFFYELRHQAVFEALVAMHEAGEAIDIITIGQRLKDRQRLDTVGGVAYLDRLMNAVPSAANLDYYFRIVWEKYILRKMIHACTRAVGRAQEHEGEVEALMDEVETVMLRLNEERAGEAVASMNKLINAAINNIEEKSKRGPNEVSGLSTSFPKLDRMTDGLRAGEMIILAARPSMGKTSLAMNIAEHVALEEQEPVGVFSLEMTASSLVERMLFSLARMNLRHNTALAQRDYTRLAGAATKLNKARLYIDDTPGLSILQLRAKARRMNHQHRLKLIVVDYLQLLHSTSRRSTDNRQQEIAEISSGLKALAKELELPIIVLSQLNREVEKRGSGDARPRLSDLRESGSIEQDADLVGLLYRAESDDEGVDLADDPAGPQAVNLHIAKQRNGPTGDVEMTFMKGYTRFESRSPVGDDDVPRD